MCVYVCVCVKVVCIYTCACVHVCSICICANVYSMYMYVSMHMSMYPSPLWRCTCKVPR